MDSTAINECLRFASSEKNMHEIFTFVLNKVVLLTGSKYGFIGEKMTNMEGQAYFRYHALAGFPADSAYIRTFNKNGYIDMVQPDTLHCHVLSDNIVVNHDIPAHRAGRPLPEGHPDIKNAAFYPLKNGSAVIGVLGLSADILTDELLRKAENMAEVVASIMVITLDRRATIIHKDNFLANISHEIRTPLNGIVSCTSMLKESPLTGPQKELVSIISQCSIQLLDIANDILDYTKIVTGNLKLNLKPMSLKKCINDVTDLYRNKIAERGLQFKLTCADTVPDMVVGDSTRLVQMLLNLLSNALKFTKKGTIEIQIEAVKVSPDRCTLRFNVSDTGIGIAPSRLETIFNSFQYNDNYLCSDCGVGLGLPITKQLILLHNGKIWINSTVQTAGDAASGTIVSFTLDYQLYQIDVDKSVLAAHYNGRNVLVICQLEDRKSLFSALASYNIRPILTTNYQEAETYLQNGIFSFDSVLVDRELITPDLVKYVSGLKVICICGPISPVPSISRPATPSSSGPPRLFRSSSPSILNPDAEIMKPITDKNVHHALSIVYALSSDEHAQVENIQHVRDTPVKIIVAEDNTVNQTVIKKMLNSLGYYDIVMTYDGLELYMELIKNDYDVALVDLKMPIMDGLSAVRKFKETSHKSVVLVAVTASMSQETRDSCYAAGMNGYITKPLKISELDHILKLVSNEKRSHV